MSSTTTTDKTAGRVLLPDCIVPSRYDLNLTPDLEAFTFTGTCKITLSTTTIPAAAAAAGAGASGAAAAADTSKHIVLHAKELCFKAANYVVMLDDGKAEAPVECEEVSCCDGAVIEAGSQCYMYVFHQTKYLTSKNTSNSFASIPKLHAQLSSLPRIFHPTLPSS
jgi:hypothetical protein